MSAQKLIMTVDVTLTGREIVPDGDYETWTLPFVAQAEGSGFKGATRPGFSDIQRRRGGELLEACADYVLEGTDATGTACQIHVINRYSDGVWRPKLSTDSEALAFLNGIEAWATLDMRPGIGPIVRMYASI